MKYRTQIDEWNMDARVCVCARACTYVCAYVCAYVVRVCLCPLTYLHKIWPDNEIVNNDEIKQTCIILAFSTCPASVFLSKGSQLRRDRCISFESSILFDIDNVSHFI